MTTDDLALLTNEPHKLVGSLEAFLTHPHQISPEFEGDNFISGRYPVNFFQKRSDLHSVENRIPIRIKMSQDWKGGAINPEENRIEARVSCNRHEDLTAG
jgi:hypothetical protein